MKPAVKLALVLVLPYVAAAGFSWLARHHPDWHLLETLPLVAFSALVASCGAFALKRIIQTKPDQPKRQKPFLLVCYLLFILFSLPLLVLA